MKNSVKPQTDFLSPVTGVILLLLGIFLTMCIEKL